MKRDTMDASPQGGTMRFVLAASLASSCVHTTPPPKLVDPVVGAQASAALRLGARTAGNLESIAAIVELSGGDAASLRTAGACVASRVIEAVFKSGADGVALAVHDPTFPGGSVSVVECGIPDEGLPVAVSFIVAQAIDVTSLALDIGAVEHKDPCGYAYAMATFQVARDVIADTFTGDPVAVVTWEPQPLTGGACVAQ